MKTGVTQMVILGIFIFFLVVGVFIFATYGTKSQNYASVQVEIWGTIREVGVATLIKTVNSNGEDNINAIYREIPPNSFDQTLVEALADGEGPDAILIPSSSLIKNQKKITLIGYDSLSERNFKDSFVEGSEILLTAEGSYGIPILVDPLVMYWNRDILTAKGVARPPVSWEEVLSITNLLTERREDRTITKSAVALGDYTNVRFSKEIISALIMQSGGALVLRNSNGGLTNYLSESFGYEVSPFVSSIAFFTQFSDPLKPIYSWNRSLPSSETAFVNGDLAFYFAPASEIANIRSKNPSLNFDVAPLPQSKNALTKKTSGTIYSLSILNSSPNQSAAFYVLSLIAGAQNAQAFSDIVNLPPARRDLLSVMPGSASKEVFWQSALWTYPWLDPDPIQTDMIFRDGFDSVVTGKSRTDSAGSNMSKRIDELLR